MASAKDVLEPLKAFFRGKSFTAETEELAMKERCKHFSPLVTQHFDLPLEEPSEHDLAMFKQCSICGNAEAAYKWTLLEENLAGELARLGDTQCRLHRWGLGNHLFHRECFAAAWFDRLVIGGGMMMRSNQVSIQPMCVTREKILEYFNVAEESTQVVKLSLKTDGTCPFCKSLGISSDEGADRTESCLRAIGFCEQEDSPRMVLKLCRKQMPFPVAGNASLRLVFTEKYLEELMEHGRIGTILDFNGYRAMDIRIIKQDQGKPKECQRLAFNDSGYAIVPAQFVALKGFAFFLQHPIRSLRPTFTGGSMMLVPGKGVAVSIWGSIREIEEYEAQLDLGNDGAEKYQRLVLAPLDEGSDIDKPIFILFDEIEIWLSNVESRIGPATAPPPPPTQSSSKFAGVSVSFGSHGRLVECRKSLESWKQGLLSKEGFPLPYPTTSANFQYVERNHPLSFGAEMFAQEADQSFFEAWKVQYNRFLKARTEKFRSQFSGERMTVRVMSTEESAFDVSDFNDTKLEEVLVGKNAPQHGKRDGTIDAVLVRPELVNEFGYVTCKQIAEILELDPVIVEVPNGVMKCSKHLLLDSGRIFLTHMFSMSQEDSNHFQTTKSTCIEIVKEAASRIATEEWEEDVWQIRHALTGKIHTVLSEKFGTNLQIEQFETPRCSHCSGCVEVPCAWSLVLFVLNNPHMFSSNGADWFVPSDRVLDGQDYSESKAGSSDQRGFFGSPRFS